MSLTKVSYSMIDGAPLNILDFGAVGDGATNNYNAFVAAFAAARNKKIVIPAGTYNIQFSGGTALSVPENVIFEGESFSNTIITFIPSSTSFRTLINISNNFVTFKNICINANVPSTGQVAFFNLNASNVFFESCKFDGLVTNVGATLSHNSYGLSYPASGVQDNLSIEKCILTRLTYPFLKTNASTSTQSSIQVLNSVFTENYYNDLGLNGPNGLINKVLISGNTFSENKTTSSVGPTQSLGVAFASVKNFTISDNVFSGVYTDAIHIEENSTIGSIANNTFDVDGSCIEFNANDENTSGTVYSPSNISVIGNSLTKAGIAAEANKNGIRLILNPSLQVPAKDIVIANNNVYNFDAGIFQNVYSDYAISITDNLIKSCNIGIEAIQGSLSISGNVTDTCTIGVKILSNLPNVFGMINEHCFIDCTTPVDEKLYNFSLCNPKFIYNSFPIGTSSSVQKNILPTGLNDRIYGFLEITTVAEATSGGISNKVVEVTWDGTTFTQTNKIQYQASILTTAVGASSNMYVQANNTSASVNLTSVVLQVKLNGMAILVA